MNKKILSLLFTSTLVLGACDGYNTETEDQEETVDDEEVVAEDTDNESDDEETEQTDEEK